MPTDLRDRIAEAVYEFYTYDPAVDPDQWKYEVADAVIRELGLKEVIDVNRSVPQSRYVTEWVSDTPPPK